jgi:hypothetical protein
MSPERHPSPLPDDPPLEAEEAGAIGPDPELLAQDQRQRALDWLAQMRAGAGFRWLWPSLHRLTGRLLPTWSVYVGGYPKTAKTTLLQTQARGWAEAGTRVAYIGTETVTEILKLQSAALTLGLPVERVVTGELTDPEAERVARDLTRQDELARRLMYAETSRGDLADVLYWIRWARTEGAEVVVFDHLHRLDVGGGSERWTQLADAVQALTGAAKRWHVLLVVAAQLRERADDALANHEVPGDRQWLGGSKIQQEGVVNLQLWRPLRSGVSAEDKAAVRRGELRLSAVLKPNTIGVRCSAHRMGRNTYGELAHLRIVDDVIDEWPSW